MSRTTLTFAAYAAIFSAMTSSSAARAMVKGVMHEKANELSPIGINKRQQTCPTSPKRRFKKGSKR
jgi:hypothetical protein